MAVLVSWCLGQATELPVWQGFHRNLNRNTPTAASATFAAARTGSGPKNGRIDIPDVGWRSDAEVCTGFLNPFVDSYVLEQLPGCCTAGNRPKRGSGLLLAVRSSSSLAGGE